MKVEINKRYPLPCAGDLAWAMLQDVEAVAACLPGAAITERVDERHFKGTVKVKVGPAALAFRGELELQDVDADRRTLRLLGKGRDRTGTSGAEMDMTATIEAGEDGTCVLVGTSEVSMSGKVASLGARMMDSVADRILDQFVANFAQSAGTMQPQPAAAGETEQNTAGPPTSGASELNGVALMWSVLKDWLRSLFVRKPA